MTKKPPPLARRDALRSLRYTDAEEGKVIVGSPWLDFRIISPSRDEATTTAMTVWSELVGS